MSHFSFTSTIVRSTLLAGSALWGSLSFACWGPTCGDIFHPEDKWKIPAPPSSGQILDNVVDQIGAAVGRDGTFIAAATEGRWNKDNCVTNGTLTASAVAALYSAPICAAAGVGLGTGPCLGAVAGAGTAVTAVACTQLCTDHRLAGEECGNP